MVEQNAQISNLIDYIEFNVADIERSKAFYEQAFGWTYVDYGPDYCEFNDGRMKGGFTTQDPVNTGGPLIVFYHDDLQSALANIVAAGGEITKEIFQFPGGERFQFKDLDGYELAVWRTKS
jgi:predicted enzyme related to lactoylglutathione lyase